MREMKDSGVAWIGEIPETWSINKMKYIGTYINGYAFKPDDWGNTGLPIIRIQDLTGSNNNPNYFNGNIDQKYYVENGDILVSWAATLDAFEWNKGEGWLNQHIFKAIPQKDIVSKPYYIWLLKVAMSYMNDDNKHGIMMQHITLPVFNNFSIAIPPLEDQQKIAAHLDRKCTQIDALISNAQQQIEKLKAYKQSVITETVTKGLDPDVQMKDSGVEWIGEIPEHWEIVRIKNICQFNSSIKKSFSDDDIVSYAPMECVRTGSLVHKEIAIKNVSSGLTYFEENDIIMAKVTPCFENGNIAIATGLTKGMAFGSSELFVFRANESIKFFLFYFLQNNIFKKFSISTMTGTGGLKRVSPNFVNNYSFALPPIEERNKIVFYLDRKCSQIDKLIDLKQQKIEKLQQYKKSLIYEYVTGKKEV